MSLNANSQKTVDHACKCNRPNFTTLLVPSDLQRYTCKLGTYKAIKDSVTNIKATVFIEAWIKKC